MQILAVEGLLAGAERPELPPAVDRRAFQKASKARRRSDERQGELL